MKERSQRTVKGMVRTREKRDKGIEKMKEKKTKAREVGSEGMKQKMKICCS